MTSLPRSQPGTASELLPCPLCASTNVSPGTCYVDLGRFSPYTSGQQPAVRCVDCGCRATLKAWNTRSPSVDAGARDALTRNSQAPDPCTDLTINELIEWMDSPQYTNGHLDFEAANHMSAAAELLDKLFPESALQGATK